VPNSNLQDAPFVRSKISIFLNLEEKSNIFTSCDEIEIYDTKSNNWAQLNFSSNVMSVIKMPYQAASI